MAASSGTVACSSANPQESGFAEASIRAESFGNISVFAFANGFATGAYASASYSSSIDYGPLPGIVTGMYALIATVAAFLSHKGRPDILLSVH